MHIQQKNICDDCKHFMMVICGEVLQHSMENVHTRTATLVTMAAVPVAVAHVARTLII